MSVEANKAIVRRYTEAVWNRGELPLIAELCAPDYVVHAGAERQVLTTAMHKILVGAWRDAFPDCHWTVEDEIGEGDLVVQRLTGRGTHTGFYTLPLVGAIAPTGRPVTVAETAMYRLAGGVMVECWSEIDWLGLLLQLGVLSQPPDPAER